MVRPSSINIVIWTVSEKYSASDKRIRQQLGIICRLDFIERVYVVGNTGTADCPVDDLPFEFAFIETPAVGVPTIHGLQQHLRMTGGLSGSDSGRWLIVNPIAEVCSKNALCHMMKEMEKGSADVIFSANQLAHPVWPKQATDALYHDLQKIYGIPAMASFLQANNPTARPILLQNDGKHADPTPGGSAGLPGKVSCLVFDFDGVFTDNRVCVDENGIESVFCSRGDGMGIEKLRSLGVPMFVISKEQNKVVTARCAKLRIPVLQGIEDKVAALQHWLDQYGISHEHVVFVGNDENDIPCLQFSAFCAVPADAHNSVIQLADMVLSQKGGRGAVRELCDMLYDALETGKTTLA